MILFSTLLILHVFGQSASFFGKKTGKKLLHALFSDFKYYITEIGKGNPIMPGLLKSLWKYSNRRERLFFYLLLLLMFVAANLELLGIGLLLPVVALLLHPFWMGPVAKVAANKSVPGIVQTDGSTIDITSAGVISVHSA